jgi:hypothetical protein
MSAREEETPPDRKSRCTPEDEIDDDTDTDKDDNSDVDLALADCEDADDEGEGEKHEGVFLIEDVMIPRPPLHAPPLSCYGKGMGKDKGKGNYRVTAYYTRTRKLHNKWGSNNLGCRGSGGAATSSNVQGL